MQHAIHSALLPFTPDTLPLQNRPDQFPTMDLSDTLVQWCHTRFVPAASVKEHFVNDHLDVIANPRPCPIECGSHSHFSLGNCPTCWNKRAMRCLFGPSVDADVLYEDLNEENGWDDAVWRE